MRIHFHALPLTFLLFLSFGSHAVAQSLPEETSRAILRAQDLRDAAGLTKYLDDPSSAIKAKAARAAGSVQDTVHSGLLLALLSDTTADVRKAAAFALGQMNAVVDSTQRATISHRLLEHLTREEDPEVQIRLAEALGKIGNRESLEEVAAAAPLMKLGARGEVALAIGRYAYRNISSSAGTRAAAGFLDTPGEEWKAAYALMRIGNGELLRPYAAQLTASAHHADPQVRMFIATALGKMANEPSALDALIGLVGADADWRVRVNAVKSLAGVDLRLDLRVGSTLVKTISDPNEHVSLAALTSVAGMKVKGSGLEDQMRTSLVSMLDGAFTSRQKREAAIALAKMSGTDAYPVIVAAGSKGSLLRTAYIEALGCIPSGNAQAELLSYSQQADPKVRRAALEAILTSCALAPPSRGMVLGARSSFVRALASEDVAVITTAAGALADSLFADSTVVVPLLETLSRLKSPRDAEPMAAVIQALGSLKAGAAISTLISTMNDSDRTVAWEAAVALEKITGKEYRQYVAPNSLPSHTNFDWATFERLRKQPEMRVATSRGTFVITMFPDDAPFTCLNALALVSKGFYDGLLFHRVVPNFVVQGGDPRGDGWGGPGYAIRSEFGYLRYERGMVGMASAGKDTEGSQFFITHSRQPHLDGRYTIFGRVTAGMDVVDRIQVGDTITRITFANGTTPGGSR